MNATVSLHPGHDVAISAHWKAPQAPGWMPESGWVKFAEKLAGEDESGVVVYLDRPQLLRLGEVVAELVSRLPHPESQSGTEVDVQR